MLIKVDGDEVKVMKEHCDETPETVKTLCRVKEELEGFLQYKHMAEKVNPTRYITPSMQEFQHMLLALDDFITQLVPLLNAEERAEFNKFIKSIVPA